MELNEEKMKQILGEHLVNIQAHIDMKVDKAVKEIKEKLEKEENVATYWWFFGITLTIFASGITLFIYGADKDNLVFLQSGFSVIALCGVMWLLLAIVNLRQRKTKQKS